MRLVAVHGADVPDQCGCAVCVAGRTILGMVAAEAAAPTKTAPAVPGTVVIGNYYAVAAFRCEGCNYVTDSEPAMHHHIITRKCEW